MEYSDDFYIFYLFFKKAKENEAMTLDWERVEGTSWQGELGCQANHNLEKGREE